MRGFFNRLFRILVLTAAVSVCFFISAHADNTLISDADSLPPFTVLHGDHGKSGEISFYLTKEKETCLFLPESADPSKITIRYDGDLAAYDAAADRTIDVGGSFTADLSGPLAYLYEYNEADDTRVRYTIRIMRGGNIPTVFVTLDGGDQALININSSKDNNESGYITVAGADGSVIYGGEMTRMSGHGNTSYDQSGKLNTKNSYNFNTADKTELIPGAGKSKKWTMLRIRTNGNYDPTGFSYLMAFNSYNALVGDGSFNISSCFTDLYINGEYRGVYILTERMDINGSMNVTDLESKTDMPSGNVRRVSGDGDDPAIAAGIKSYSYAADSSVPEGTDITGGYVLEIMCGFYGTCGFQTANNMFVNIKSPAYPTREMVQYIAQYVQEFENALFSDTGYNELGKHYTEYADEKGFAAQTLIYAFYLNWEIYRTSTYLTKDVGEILKFGPVWDFESGPAVMFDETLFGKTFAYNDVMQQYCWFEQAWKKGSFMSLITGLNEQLRDIIDQILGHTDAKTVQSFDDCAGDVRASQEMNWLRWRQPNDFDTCLEEYRESLEARYETWFGRLWNPKKYLLGLTVDGKDNGDGTWTLTGSVIGRMESDYLVWFEMKDDHSKGEYIGSGESISVPAGGRYYARVTGWNNAYYHYANGSVFSAQTVVMTSNIIMPGSSYLEPGQNPESGAADADTENGSEAFENSGREIYVIIAAAVIVSIASAAVAAALIRKKVSANR